MNLKGKIFSRKSCNFSRFNKLLKRYCTAAQSETKCTTKPVLRNYLSRMNFTFPAEIEKNILPCKSQELFQYSQVFYPVHAGTFHYLPFGLRALEKLQRIIDEELQSVGCQKMSMPTLAQSVLWKKTGRWDTNELFKLKDRHHKEYCLGPTHEELVTSMVAEMGKVSHKSLPLMLYQITRKFRDEMHPKYGFLRGREFEMKDLYTFDKDEESARETYDLICDTYNRIFTRLGLRVHKVEGATGNIGGKLSHEYHLQAAIGEDTFYTCEKCGLNANAELVDGVKFEAGKDRCSDPGCCVVKSQGIEVGHAFLLGTKYSEVFDARVSLPSGDVSLMVMGCYGLGVSRLLQASVEVLSGDKQVVWPSLIAPYQVCIIPQMAGYMSEEFNSLADGLSDALTGLQNLKGEVVIDDRIQKTVGKRMKGARQQGYPYIIVINRKTLEEPRLYEVINTVTDTTEMMSLSQLVDKFSTIQTVRS